MGHSSWSKNLEVGGQKSEVSRHLISNFEFRNVDSMLCALIEYSLTKLSHVAIELDLWDSRFSPIIMIGLALWWNLIDDASMRRKGVELYHG